MADGWRRILTEPNLSAIDVHAFLNQAVSMQARAALPGPCPYTHALPLSLAGGDDSARQLARAPRAEPAAAAATHRVSTRIDRASHARPDRCAP